MLNMSVNPSEEAGANTPVKTVNIGKKASKTKIVALTAIAAVIGVAVYYFVTQNNTVATNGFEYENNATVGLMPGVDRDSLLAEMQKSVDESAIAFSINSNPVLENSHINILFENPVGNNKDIVLEIFENDTQNSLFKSKAIREGSYLETAKLNTSLAKGEHSVTVYITAYHVETHEMIGQAAAEITIIAL